MVVKTTDSAKEGFRFLADIVENRVPKNEAYRALHYLLDNKLDIFDNLSHEKKEYVNNKVNYVLDCTKRCELNENMLYLTVEEISETIGQEVTINLEFFLLIISTSMFNSTLKVLSCYNNDIIEKITKKVLLKILD
jgi:hypothetical protein